MALHKFEHLGPRRKVAKVIGEFKAGDVRSGSGAKVKKRRQAVAIASSAAGLSRKRNRKR